MKSQGAVRPQTWSRHKVFTVMKIYPVDFWVMTACNVVVGPAEHERRGGPFNEAFSLDKMKKNFIYTRRSW